MPYFLNGVSFPSIGPTYASNSQTIPAKVRYNGAPNIYPKHLIMSPTPIINVTVKNDFDYGTLTIDSNNKNSPYNSNWGHGSTHTISAMDQYSQKSGEINYYRVFKYWKFPNSNIYQARTVTKQFYLSDDYLSVFDKAVDLTIDNTFLNGGAGGSVKINDGSPINVPVTSHVILNTSLKAEALQHVLTVNGRNITYNFSNWNDNNKENPRFFNLSDHESKNVVYKGHLVSSSSGPTGATNGRRTAQTYNRNYHLVYADGGSVYYSHSTDGTSWSAEKRISTLNENCANPALAVSSNNMVYITWYNHTDYKVKFRIFNDGTQAWDPVHTVGLVAFDGVIDPKPAIAVSNIDGTPKMYVAFEQEQMGSNFLGNGVAEISVYKNSANDGSAWSTVLGPFNGSHPALSYNKDGGFGDIGLVWGNIDKIYFRKTDNSGVWGATIQVNPNLSYIFGEKYPTLSFSSGMAHIAWEGMEEDEIAEIEKSNIYYRRYDTVSGQLGPMSTFSADGDKNNISPTISTHNGNGNDYTLMFADDENTVKKIVKNSSSATQTNMGTGNGPSLPEKGDEMALWTKYNNAPYFVHTVYTASGGGGFYKSATTDSSYQITLHKRFSYEWENGYLALDLTGSKVNNQQGSYSDSLNQSNPLYFTGNDAIHLHWKISHSSLTLSGINPDDALLSVYLREGETRSLLKTYTVDMFSDENTRDIKDDFIYYAKSGKTARFEIVSEQGTPIITNMLKAGNRKQTMSKTSHAYFSNELPQKFHLYTNYPNPFNPTSQIRFDLPQGMHALLEVYNSSGQRVATLVNKELSAGSYDVVFDGRGLASGIYIYRFSALGQKSGKRINAVKRMLLIK